jgi:hypothetical protein
MEFLILAGVILLLFYSSDPILYPDSPRYISGSLLDPPLYSTIIKVMLLIFGTLNSVVVLQALFVSLSIIYFTRTVAVHFSMHTMTKTLISLFLFIPILQFYNVMLTEPLSYAFSLFFVSFVLKLIFNFNSQNLIWSTVFAISLLLTRSQFMFLYPVILLLYLGILFLLKSKKTLAWLAVSFLSIFLVHNSLIFLNEYAKKDSLNIDSISHDSLGPFFYTYIDAIYISSAKDIQLFENQNSQQTLSKIFKEMESRKALMKHYNGRGHFGLSLGHIKNYSKSLLKDLANQQNTEVISIKKNISIKLIKANFEKYIKHIFKKFYDSSWLFVFVPFSMLLAGLISFLKYKSNFSLLVLFISTFSLANHSVVYLFGRVQPRYFIYTDFVLLIFIFILLNIFLQKKDII